MNTKLILDLDSEHDATEREKERRRWRRTFIALLLIAITVRLSPWMTWQSKTLEDGRSLTIRNYWATCLDYAYGNPPNWQRRILPDGAVFEGPLKNGLQHGMWRQMEDDETIVLQFDMGRPAPPVRPK